MLKIVIADDDEFVTSCLYEMIDWNALECEVVGAAANGEEAYRLLLETKADVMITDVKMPVMDGVALAKKIRETDSETDIIFLSAYEDFEAAKAGIKYNVINYILKPLDDKKVKELNEIITSLRDKKEDYEYCRYMVTEKDFEKTVTENLAEGNKCYFEDFFKDICDGMTWERNMASTVCMKMLNILYDYLYTIGISKVGEDKQESKEVLKNLTSISEMFDYTHRLYINFCTISETKRDASYEDIAVAIRKFINTHYADYEMSLQLISETFHFSQQHLRRIFKRSMGMTINEYIQEVRLKNVARLLDSTDYAVKKIAGMTGFSDANYLSRSFRKKYGISPNEYKYKIVKNIK